MRLELKARNPLVAKQNSLFLSCGKKLYHLNSYFCSEFRICQYPNLEYYKRNFYLSLKQTFVTTPLHPFSVVFLFSTSPLSYLVSISKEVLTCKARTMPGSSLLGATPKCTYSSTAQMLIVGGVVGLTWSHVPRFQIPSAF